MCSLFWILNVFNAPEKKTGRKFCLCLSTKVHTTPIAAIYSPPPPSRRPYSILVELFAVSESFIWGVQPSSHCTFYEKLIRVYCSGNSWNSTKGRQKWHVEKRLHFRWNQHKCFQIQVRYRLSWYDASFRLIKNNLFAWILSSAAIQKRFKHKNNTTAAPSTSSASMFAGSHWIAI